VIFLTWSRIVGAVDTWIVEVRLSEQLSPAAVERVRHRLSRWRPSVTVEDDGCSVRVEVQADGPIYAIATTTRHLEGTGPIAHVAATTIDEAKRQVTSPHMPDLVGVLDIQEMAGLRTKQRALQITELASFPQPALKTRAGRLWTRTAVEHFLADWPRRTGRPPTRPAAEPDDRPSNT
jgi:hypothetical protein